MTVKELMDELSKMPPEMRVVIPAHGYDDTGEVDDCAISSGDAFSSEEPDEGEVPESIVIVHSSLDPEEARLREQIKEEEELEERVGYSLLFRDANTGDRLEAVEMASDMRSVIVVNNRTGKKFKHTVQTEEIG